MRSILNKFQSGHKRLVGVLRREKVGFAGEYSEKLSDAAIKRLMGRNRVFPVFEYEKGYTTPEMMPIWRILGQKVVFGYVKCYLYVKNEVGVVEWEKTEKNGKETTKTYVYLVIWGKDTIEALKMSDIVEYQWLWDKGIGWR